MVLFIRGNKQPAILRFISPALHPFPYGEFLPARTIDTLQVSHRLDIVGQHTSDGDGCLLNLTVNQRGGRCTGKESPQLIQLYGQKCTEKFVIAAVFIWRMRSAPSAKIVRALPCQNGSSPLLAGINVVAAFSSSEMSRHSSHMSQLGQRASFALSTLSRDSS